MTDQDSTICDFCQKLIEGCLYYCEIERFQSEDVIL